MVMGQGMSSYANILHLSVLGQVSVLRRKSSAIRFHCVQLFGDWCVSALLINNLHKLRLYANAR